VPNFQDEDEDEEGRLERKNRTAPFLRLKVSFCQWKQLDFLSGRILSKPPIFFHKVNEKEWRERIQKTIYKYFLLID